MDLPQLLGPYYEACPTSSASCLRVWSVRISAGKLFVGLGSWASPAAPGYIAVLDLSSTKLQTIIEIGRRFPHEIAVDGENGFVYSAAIDLIDPTAELEALTAAFGLSKEEASEVLYTVFNSAEWVLGECQG
jgi:hypothetical protein